MKSYRFLALFSGVLTLLFALTGCTVPVMATGRYTAEDFAFYTEKVPGCMCWLGIRDEKHTSPLHSDTFDFDESVLVKGIAAFIAVADAKSI